MFPSAPHSIGFFFIRMFFVFFCLQYLLQMIQQEPLGILGIEDRLIGSVLSFPEFDS